MSHPAINIATEAAYAAGEMMRRSLKNLDSVPVAKKARHDYVCEVDRACEAAIVKEIMRFHPDHAFLGEEGGMRGESETVWVIDPLDGTSNYLHGIPHFAVSIAQQVNGRTEHGVIYDPMRDELFTASRGKGAFLNSQRIRVSQRKTLDDAILATAFPFRQRQDMASYTKIFSSVYRKVEDIRRAGSAALDRSGFWSVCGPPSSSPAADSPTGPSRLRKTSASTACHTAVAVLPAAQQRPVARPHQGTRTA